jgi:hypothetical protein
MKKLFFVSGLLALAFGILFVTGVLDFNHTVSRAFTSGNRLYAEERFNEALTAYNTGLQKEPDDLALNYNAAQASYRIKNYEQAIEFYKKASGTVDLYLNQGNSSLRLGDDTEDANQKIQYYTNAQETYKQGILLYPQSVELKFNYEFVLEKIEALQENMANQQQNDTQENPDNQDQNQQQSSGQENQNGNQEGQQNNQQSDQQGNEGNSQDNQQSGEENENSPGEGQENEQQNSEDQQTGNSGQDNPQEPEDQQSGTSGQDDQQNPEDQQSGVSGQGDQSEDSQDQQDGTPPASAGDENSEQTGSAAEGTVQGGSETDRILQMLERQEEEALKNNQRIRGSGKEDEHDW